MTKNVDPSTKHPSFAAHQQKVGLCYDAFYGHVRKPCYVPQLSDQEDGEYSAYVNRPAYLNAVERTLQSMIGVMTTEPVTVFGAEEPSVFGSKNLDAFYQDLIMDTSLGGRILVCVDIYTEHDRVEPELVGTPYLTYYASENIINWSDDFIMIEVTTMERDPENPYSQVPVTRWKELFLGDVFDANGNVVDATFQTRVWSKVKGKFEASEPVELLINGQPINYLAAWYATPYDNESILYNPVLTTISELNISHLRLSCDQYQGLHYLALPTFTVSGELSEDEEGRPQQIKLGSTKQALHMKAGGTATYTEFSGAGLNAVASEKQAVENAMDAQGAKLVTPKSGNETATATEIRAKAEGAVLMTMANALESAMNGALELYSQITGSPVQIELHRAFLNIDTAMANNLEDTTFPKE